MGNVLYVGYLFYDYVRCIHSKILSPCIVKTQSHTFYPVQERFCILIFVKFLSIGTIKLKFKTSKFINFDLSTAVA